MIKCLFYRHISCEASGTGFGHPPQLWTHVSATLADAAHAFTPCFATRLTHHARRSLHVASGGWHHCQPHVAAHCHLSTRGLRHSPASRFRSHLVVRREVR